MANFTPVTPKPTEASSPFWKNAKNGTLTLLRCDHCGTWIYYMKAQCPHCAGSSLSWKPCSGKGEVFSFTIVQRPASPSFADRVPYVLAIIELEEGVKMMSHIIHCHADQVQIGMKVEAVFDEVSENMAVPYFQPCNEQESRGTKWIKK